MNIDNKYQVYGITWNLLFFTAILWSINNLQLLKQLFIFTAYLPGMAYLYKKYLNQGNNINDKMPGDYNEGEKYSEDYKTVIICTECSYRNPTTEKHPTIAGNCPDCGNQLTYDNKEAL